MISDHKDPASLKPTILIVEDNAQFRQLVSDFLTLAGYRIDSAVSGMAAMAILQQGDSIPDLIIADIIMDNMDGCEFLHAVRNQWRTIPFIMMSTGSTFEASCPDMTLKPEAYIAKPFSYAELLRVIETILLS